MRRSRLKRKRTEDLSLVNLAVSVPIVVASVVFLTVVFPNAAAQNSFALALLSRLGLNLKKLLVRNHAPKKKRAVPNHRNTDFLALDLNGTLLAKLVAPVLSAVVQALDMVASTTETALSVTSLEVVAVALLLLLRSRMTAQSESKVATLEILKSQSLRKKKLSKKLLPK